jgi:Domain of unknown function (DUF1918)
MAPGDASRRRAGVTLAAATHPESERVDAPPHTAMIVGVLQKERARYEVRWDDGHTSIFVPSAGVTRIKKKRRQKARA